MFIRTQIPFYGRYLRYKHLTSESWRAKTPVTELNINDLHYTGQNLDSLPNIPCYVYYKSLNIMNQSRTAEPWLFLVFCNNTPFTSNNRFVSSTNTLDFVSNSKLHSSLMRRIASFTSEQLTPEYLIDIFNSHLINTRVRLQNNINSLNNLLID